MSKPSVFISYSHQDEKWKDRLVKQLGVLEGEGLLAVWHDRLIGGGNNWLAEIQAAIEGAEVALLLISADFLNSRFILGQEVPALLKRQEEKGLRIMPVITKECPWRKISWLSLLNARPRDGKALEELPGQRVNGALSRIAEEVLGYLQPKGDGPSPSSSAEPGRDLGNRQSRVELDAAGEKTNENLCLVIMGFGKKTDFETGRTLDLDQSYRNMIKPAVEAAGLRCIRADEIVHSGLIDVSIFNQILKADLVITDLSTSNKNAYYELGVRHALRPQGTIVISEDGIKTFPFDINRFPVMQYHHLGEDIGFDEIMRFRKVLTGLIIDVMKGNVEDSPVYSSIVGLQPPVITAQAQVAEKRGGQTTTVINVSETPQLSEKRGLFPKGKIGQ